MSKKVVGLLLVAASSWGLTCLDDTDCPDNMDTKYHCTYEFVYSTVTTCVPWACGSETTLEFCPDGYECSSKTDGLCYKEDKKHSITTLPIVIIVVVIIVVVGLVACCCLCKKRNRGGAPSAPDAHDIEQPTTDNDVDLREVELREVVL